MRCPQRELCDSDHPEFSSIFISVVGGFSRAACDGVSITVYPGKSSHLAVAVQEGLGRGYPWDHSEVADTGAGHLAGLIDGCRVGRRIAIVRHDAQIRDGIGLSGCCGECAA
jgi:hypothetical protein